MRISLLLVTGLLAVGGVAFASDSNDPIQAAMDQFTQDALTQSFSQDLVSQPLQVNSIEGVKAEALDEFLPERSEDSGVLGDVKSLAKNTFKGTYKVIAKPTVLIFGGIKSVLDYIPGAGPDSKTEKVETAEAHGVPSLELKVGDENRHTFFEREFARQLAGQRTAQDFSDPAQEELRGMKVLKIMLLQMDFGSDK